MRCQWQEFINLLPGWMRQPVDEHGAQQLQELHLRMDEPPQLILKNQSIWLNKPVRGEDLRFCINAATKYSPWTAGSIQHGYITAPGGHRIGLCGECSFEGQALKNIAPVTSLCMRVARDFYGISADTWKEQGSVLIIGPPGSGKTTFLRDLIRQISNHGKGAVTVLDERRELFPCSAGKFFFERGRQTDVLSGGRKQTMICCALQTMSPSVIALDEITAAEDCAALLEAAWCGVQLIATAHAGSKEELYARKTYEPLVSQGIFDTLITMRTDKTWQKEGFCL